MSEAFEKFLSKRRAEIEAYIKQQIEYIVNGEINRFKAELDRLQEIAKIQLPTYSDILNILANGGYAYSKEFNNENDYAFFNVYIGGRNVFDWVYGTEPRLKAGKYRVTLIIERLSENVE